MKKIKIKDIVNFWLILILFEPTIFVKNSFTNLIFILGACISFFYVLVIILLKENKVPKLLMLLIVFRIIIIINTIGNNGDILKVGYQSIVIVALFMHAVLFHKKNKMGEFISILAKIFSIYLAINACLYVIFPSGLYSNRAGIHFLGIRTRFTEYAVISILLAIMDYKVNNTKKIKLCVRILIALLNILLPAIATAIVGVTIMVIAYIILSQKRIKFDYRILLLIGIIINLLVVFFRIQNIFADIIENVLNKSISLTGRTDIWDASYKYIFNKNILFGNGNVEDGNFIFYGWKFWQAHNQILQMLYEAGAIGTAIFYFIWSKMLKQLNDYRKNNNYAPLIGSVTFSFLVMTITEIYYYYVPFYVLWILSYYVMDFDQ